MPNCHNQISKEQFNKYFLGLLIISPNFRFMIIHYLKCICCSIKIWISLLTIRMCFSLSVMMFSATFNNILLISWRSVLLMKETGLPYFITSCCIEYALLYHIMLYRVHPSWVGFELTTLVVIGTDCIGMKGDFSVWFT